MNQADEQQLIQWLFATDALRVAPADQPFWYTSGTFGPYYINTHFLYGSEQEASVLLALIEKTDPVDLPGLLAETVMRQYEQNRIYRSLMDLLTQQVRPYAFDFISGGARRDFFFSICAARILSKPHLSLFKDQTAVYSTGGFGDSRRMTGLALAGQSAMHVADLVTEASSYRRAWLPGIEKLGAAMPRTVAVVDRNQHGRAVLAAAGTQLDSLVTISPALFDRACAAGLINEAQKDQVLSFTRDPDCYMKTFLARYPAFLQEQLALGGQNRERAERCLAQGYGQVL